jgi:hypothetical protein
MLKTRCTGLVVLLIILFSGCHNDDAGKTPYQSTLDNNIALWNHSGIARYQYTYRRNCFCLPQEDIVVVVDFNIVSEAFYTPSGMILADEDLESLFTVEELFGLIQEAIDANVARLDIIYNSVYGYPEDIYIDRDKQMVDEEIRYMVMDFQ